MWAELAIITLAIAALIAYFFDLDSVHVCQLN